MTINTEIDYHVQNNVLYKGSMLQVDGDEHHCSKCVEYICAYIKFGTSND